MGNGGEVGGRDGTVHGDGSGERVTITEHLHAEDSRRQKSDSWKYESELRRYHDCFCPPRYADLADLYILQRPTYALKGGKGDGASSLALKALAYSTLSAIVQ